MTYSYLNHVEIEFLSDEEEMGEAADNIMKGFFHSRVGTKSRAFVGDGLRYIVTDQEGEPEILEEDGYWQEGVFEVYEDNDYELIYRENGKIKTEDISASEAAEYFGADEL